MLYLHCLCHNKSSIILVDFDGVMCEAQLMKHGPLANSVYCFHLCRETRGERMTLHIICFSFMTGNRYMTELSSALFTNILLLLFLLFLISFCPTYCYAFTMNVA